MKDIKVLILTQAQRLRPWQWLLLISIAVLALGLRNPGVSQWDEAFYAEVSKQMVLRHEWVIPYWNGVPFFHKPPLYMWLTGFLFKLFGVRDSLVPITSMLSGVGLIMVMYLIGTRLFDKKKAVVGSLILLSSPYFLSLATDGMTDMLLLFCLFSMLYGILRLKEDPRFWYLASVAAGLAVMTKGAAALAAIGICVGVMLLDRRVRLRIKSRHFVLATLCFALIVVPWHLTVYDSWGSLFLDAYLGYHVVERATTAIEGNQSSLMYYPWMLVVWFSPWIFMLPFSVRKWWTVRDARTFERRQLLLFALGIFVFYSAVRTKLYWYIAPIIPVLALFIGAWLQEWGEKVTKKLRDFPWERKLWLAGLVAPALLLIAAQVWFYTGNSHYKSDIVTLASAARNGNGPLYIYQTGKANNVVYYSDRETYYVADVPEMQKISEKHPRSEVILLNSQLADFEQHFHLRRIRETETMVYGEVIH